MKCLVGIGDEVTIQVRQDLFVVKILPSELDKCATVELKYKNVRFQVGVLYIPPPHRN